MSIGIEAVDLRKPAETEAAAEIIPDILLKAEITQRIVDRKFPSDSLKGERNLTGIPRGEFNRAMEIVDKYCVESGYESPSRRILKTLSRISPVVESHGFMKKNREFEKKWKIEGNVQEQKSIQIHQGTANLVGGAATLGFNALSAVFPQWGDIFRGLSSLPQYAIPTVTNYFDAKRTPLSHEQSFFLNTTQAERQAIESLKQLPESLRNLALELMRLRVREAENIFQR
jgi:hypothetical protein